MKKRIFRTTRREGKRRNEATGEKKPYMESLLAKFRCGWRGVLEIASMKRHDTLAWVVHLELCSKWYQHSPARITENKEVKIS